MYTDSWLPLPSEEYQIIKDSFSRYAYYDAAAYFGHFLIFLGGVLAFVVNGLVITVILRSKSIRSSNSGILTLQMSLMEGTRAITSIGTPITFLITGQVLTSVETAFFSTVFGAWTTGVWLLTFALSAFDRYMTIVRQRTISKLQLTILIIVIWFMTFIFATLPAIAQHQSYYKVRVSGLYASFSYYDHTQSGLALTIVGLIYLGLPNQAISSCYSAIIKAYVAVRIQNGRFTIDGKEITDASKLSLWQTYRLIKDMGQTSSTMTYDMRTVSTSKGDAVSVKEDAQLTARQRMELLVFRKSVTTFLAFNICWLPVTVTAIYEVISGTQVPRFMDNLAVLGLLYSEVVNASLHFVLDERFKAGLRELFGYGN